MPLKKLYTLLLLLCLCPLGAALAQPFSYIYIQGDKQTPFYVKYDETMLPRYGKNYCIISQLAPGPIHLQILFQQNAYPVQDFTIVVPEAGYRGFILTRKGNSFSLYDIQQQFYLQAGNAEQDDHVPTGTTTNTYVSTTPPPAQQQEEIPDNNEGNIPPVSAPVTTTQDGPQFMGDIELSNERTVQNAPPTNTEENTVINRSILNSDCPQPMSNEAFETLYKKTAAKTEKTRLKYLLDKMDDCYSSSQVRMLAKTLPNDPERYTFLKRVYPRVYDQANFPALENLLSTREWKDYFKLIMP